MEWLLLALGASALLLSANALWPVRWPTSLGLVSFGIGWITGDLPVLLAIGQGAAAAALVGSGGLTGPVGWVGLVLLTLGWAGLAKAHAIAHAAPEAMEAALAEAGVVEPAEPWLARRLILPFPLPWSPTVRVHWNQRVAKVGRWTQRADVFAPAGDGEGRPVLVFAHGGGWISSFRQFQGVPLMLRLAQKGWVCVRVSYRLSPWCAFPDHLVDLKRGLAWTRAEAHRWGGDPDRFLALHGNSAGAHLSALAALRPNDPRYQPGFEEVDTSVDACVPVYGPMDLLNREGAWSPAFMWFLRFLVLKRSYRTHPDLWAEASPLEQVAPGAPPFLVVHGACDSLVPVSESRRFAAAMRAAGNTLHYAELPGGQHALDLFHSRRGVVAADGIARWLEHQLGLGAQVRAVGK